MHRSGWGLTMNHMLQINPRSHYSRFQTLSIIGAVTAIISLLRMIQASQGSTLSIHFGMFTVPAAGELFLGLPEAVRLEA